MLDAFAWFWMGLGVLSGAWIGLRFREPGFLGGYDAWPRRLVRLGHIAFFGTGLLCLGLAGTLSRHPIGEGWARAATWLMVGGAALMPVMCGVCARWRRMVPAFGLPVALIGGSALITWVRIVGLSLEGAR